MLTITEAPTVNSRHRRILSNAISFDAVDIIIISLFPFRCELTAQLEYHRADFVVVVVKVDFYTLIQFLYKQSAENSQAHFDPKNIHMALKASFRKGRGTIFH